MNKTKKIIISITIIAMIFILIGTYLFFNYVKYRGKVNIKCTPSAVMLSEDGMTLQDESFYASLNNDVIEDMYEIKVKKFDSIASYEKSLNDFKNSNSDFELFFENYGEMRYGIKKDYKENIGRKWKDSMAKSNIEGLTYKCEIYEPGDLSNNPLPTYNKSYTCKKDNHVMELYLDSKMNIIYSFVGDTTKYSDDDFASAKNNIEGYKDNNLIKYVINDEKKEITFMQMNTFDKEMNYNSEKEKGFLKDYSCAEGITD